ncbi:hypothetical protein CUMW_229190 [Citrus unshiu]|uniref:Myb-like domain-containing protein n=1 Tax=Citrus unshiu TaxID=55188 RepID=A0A2H5QGX3_CITUN|nr:hypothetical protein CUMW_229190 [Citrus unshiu]
MRNSQRTGVRQYNKSELPRLRWTPELHKHFSQAVERLGGKYKASPKRILHMMNVKGLKLSHIKSHLQMYRNLKNHNGDITLTMKNLQMQRAQCNNHGVLSICSPQAHRPVENEYTADWEYERSNYVKHQVFSEESSGLIHAKLAAGEDEHQFFYVILDSYTTSNPRDLVDYRQNINIFSCWVLIYESVLY